MGDETPSQTPGINYPHGLSRNNRHLTNAQRSSMESRNGQNMHAPSGYNLLIGEDSLPMKRKEDNKSFRRDREKTNATPSSNSSHRYRE